MHGELHEDWMRGWSKRVGTSAALAATLTLAVAGCDDGGSDEPAAGGDTGGAAAGEYVVRGRIDGANLEGSSYAPIIPALSSEARPTKDGDGTSPAPTSDQWQCQQDPSWPPCASCQQGTHQADCDQAIENFCETAGDDPLCPWICATDPGYGPCPSCQPGSSDQQCEDAWHEWCADNPDEEECGAPDLRMTPSSLRMKVYKVEFSTDAQNCTNPITVAEDSSPDYVDLGANPELFNVAAPPAGEYPCVIITFSDHIRWSVDGVAACAGDHVQDVFREESNPAGNEEIVTMYISTLGDPTGQTAPWTPPGLLLEQPHVAGDNVLSSSLVVYAADAVGYWEAPDGDRQPCEMGAPTFGYETTYR